MRCLVTGTAGFIGFHLAKSLLVKGNEVWGFDNLNGYYDVQIKRDRLALLEAEPRFRFVKGDLADRNEVESVFQEARPQAAVNLAAQAGVRYSLENPSAYADSNLVGFLNLLEACRRFPVEHLVYASSSSVYGNQKKVPFAESDSVDRPISLYAATKKSNELMAYSYAHLFGIPVTGLRFFTVYGPWGRPDMAAFIFTKRIMNGEPIQVYNRGEMYRDFTYIDDIVDGIERVINKAPSPDETGTRAKVYNIGNNRPVKLSRFVEVLEKIIGKKAVIESLPIQPGDVLQTCADLTEIERDFQFKPKTPIEDGLARFAAWYREYRRKTEQ